MIGLMTPSLISGMGLLYQSRNQAEKTLLSAIRKLNDIIEFLPDATFVIDMPCRISA